MSPIFSVIIPTFNRAEKLKRALRSVEQQDFAEFEVIVCDDGSSDGTRHAVEEFMDRLNIIHLWEENWGGPARPRNRGIAMASSPWVCFLDSDDWWYPNKLSCVRKALSKADVIYHDLDIYSANRKNKFKRIKSRQLNPPIINDLLTRNSRLFNSSFTVKKELIHQVGGVSENRSLIAAEDSDLWIKISKKTERFFYIPKSLGAYWLDQENFTEMTEAQINRIRALYEKHLTSLSGDIRLEATYYMNYSIGRIKQKLSQKNEARVLFQSATKSKNINLRTKSIFCLLFNGYLCWKYKQQ